jgi:hypothetical protein
MDFLELSTSADTWWRVPRARVENGAIRYLLKDTKEYALGDLLKQPAKAPHLQFRNLRDGYRADALKFLRSIGPLCIEHVPDVVEDDHRGAVDLDIFWARWRRFVAVAQLWEGHPKSPGTKGQGITLRAAFDYALAHIQQINRVPGAPPLFEPERWRSWWLCNMATKHGMTTTTAPWPPSPTHELLGVPIINRQRTGGLIDPHDSAVRRRKRRAVFIDHTREFFAHPDKYTIASPTPHTSKPFDWREVPSPRQAIPTLNDLRLEALALSLIEEELKRHAIPVVEWVQVPIRRDHADDGVSFRLHLTRTSLWQFIWTLFAQETCATRPWRICPHCNRAFHPPRQDRFFCTPRLQQLYSKRQWALRTRGAATH